MKTLIKSILVFLTGFIFFACEDNSLPDCVEGKVIGYERCSNVTLIKVISGNLKGDLISSFGRTFENVVQYPNVPSSQIFPPIIVGNDSIVFFNYRYFNKDKDEYPVDDDFCNGLTGPYEIPTIVITNYSTSNCPLSHEK